MFIKKKILGITSTLVVFGLIFVAFHGKNDDMSTLVNKDDVDLNKIPISEVHGSYVIDPDNIYEKIGFADYVFIGKVIDNRGTMYLNPVEVQDSGEKRGRPHTIYSVEVVDNIKGSLSKNEPIELIKEGGINEDNTLIYLSENDVLPIVEQFYIFIGIAQEDGSLLVAGPNSNIPLNVNTRQAVLTSQDYKTYVDGFKNQIVYDRERAVSTYDVSEK